MLGHESFCIEAFVPKDRPVHKADQHIDFGPPSDEGKDPRPAYQTKQDDLIG